MYLYRYFHKDKPWDLPVIMALLRTGTKYQIDHLRHEAILDLYRRFPTTLDAYERLEREANRHDAWNLSDNSLLLVHYAMRHGFQSIIPALLAMDGFGISDVLKAHQSTGPMMHLFLPDLRRMLLASQHVMIWQTTNMPICLSAGSDDCETPVECQRARTDSLLEMFEDAPHEYTAFVYPIDTVHWPWPALCANCGPRAGSEYEAQRRMLWDKLPSFLDLPGWDVLEKERAG